MPRLDAPARLAPPTGPEVLEVRDVGRSFAGRGFLRRAARLRALDGVSLSLRRSETLALVGESGSGKSTLGRIAMRLDLDHEGLVLVSGQDVTRLRGRGLRLLRSRVQMVFQDPYASLDPRFTVGRTLREPLLLHRGLRGAAALDEARRLLVEVGLPAEMTDRLPHEFSGGQRQRVAIARALAADPEVIIADEPTSALDVSVQAQVLDLLMRLQEERGLALLFITHDLAVVRRIAHRVVVMRAGRIVEAGPVTAVFDTPAHPYTRALLEAVPVPDPAKPRRLALGGSTPPSSGKLTHGHWAAA